MAKTFKPHRTYIFILKLNGNGSIGSIVGVMGNDLFLKPTSSIFCVNAIFLLLVHHFIVIHYSFFWPFFFKGKYSVVLTNHWSFSPHLFGYSFRSHVVMGLPRASEFPVSTCLHVGITNVCERLNPELYES